MGHRLIPAALAAILGLTGCSGPPRYVAGAGAWEEGAPPVAPATPADTTVSQEEASRWQAVYGDLLGIPYRYGGTTRRGFDCSGLVLYAYGAFDGRRLPRTVRALYDQSVPIADGELATGDLLFYNTNGRGPSHVGIYLWGDTFLHASTSLGVTLTSVYEAYYARRYLGARRLPG